MSATITVRVEGQSLAPATPEDAEILGAMPDGEVRARLTRPRSSRHQAWYWQRLHKLVANTACGDRWPTAEHMHRALLVSTGYVTDVWVPAAADNGQPGRILVPDSTSFDAMTQDEFQEYTDRAFRLVAEAFGIDVEHV